LVGVLIIAVGCESDSGFELVSENASNDPIALTQRVHFQYGAPDEVKWGDMEGEKAERAREKSMRYFKNAMEAVWTIRPKLTSETAPMDEKLRVAQQLIEEHDGAPYQYHLAQTIGRILMAQVFADGKLATFDLREARTQTLTSAEREAVGYAATLLVRHDNPNADFVSAALAHQKGHWSTAKIRSVAQQSLEAASGWLAEDCVACAKAGRQVEGAAARRAAAVQESLDHLRRLAENE